MPGNLPVIITGFCLITFLQMISVFHSSSTGILIFLSFEISGNSLNLCLYGWVGNVIVCFSSKIYTISQYQTELEELEDDEMRVKDTEGVTYYVLNVSDQKVLTNGFMYIKELLLQYHNFKMYETYKTLTDNNVKVYSVETDSITIHEDDLDKVYGYT